MANELDQDPLKIDTTATDIRCDRIVAIKYDGPGGTVTIVDGETGHPLWSSTADPTAPFDPINLFIASGLIDVTISAGTLYIYRGSGPR